MNFSVKKIVTIFLLLLLISGCIKEIDLTEGENPNTNNSNSEATNHYKRIGMYDGSFDDLIDNNSCSSVNLPVSLLANNIPLTITNTADYQLVLNIFNLSPFDVDIVVFNFPITILNQDYGQTSITSQAQFDNLSAVCGFAINNNLSAITCVDIAYPVKISLYNTVTEQTTIISVVKDQDLFNFMANLSVNELYSVQYPINAVITGNVNITVSGDNQLKSIINDCAN
ncbi:MAG: hypothetical protein A3F91_00710 [Flavobacteria bacterium RIFCSPLOWO2_12_FULL_35_11]|nr:MAG: hypothetical protein A3F91_00710 [Flavobacteria bacterium RIFCSPLOWO2_12_FULL_35_11]